MLNSHSFHTQQDVGSHGPPHRLLKDRFTGGLIAAAVMLLWMCNAAAMAADFVALSCPKQPYTINKGLHPVGISIDVLETIMSMAGTPLDTQKIKLMSYGNAVIAVRKNTAHILLNATRTKANGNQFKWVGPMATCRYVLIGKKNAEHDLAIPDDLLDKKTATIFNSQSEMALAVLGVPSDVLKRSTSFVTPLRDLAGGTVDYYAAAAATATYQMSIMGIDKKAYDVIAVYKEVPLYFAFSPDTPDELIEKLNSYLKTLEEPESDGKSQYDRIVEKYLPEGIIE